MPSTAYTESLTQGNTLPIMALRDKDARDELSPAAFRLFLSLADRWGLDENQRLAVLGDIHRQTYQKWRRGDVKSLTRDQLERISLLLGIHKGLRLLFADHDSAERWLLFSNHDVPFGGLSPLEYMVEGSINNLYKVRRYIDAWRGMK